VLPRYSLVQVPNSSPFGGIPRNWKLNRYLVQYPVNSSSPFGGIPRNWKPAHTLCRAIGFVYRVPPSGGSLEIGNLKPLYSIPTYIANLFPLRGDP